MNVLISWTSKRETHRRKNVFAHCCITVEGTDATSDKLRYSTKRRTKGAPYFPGKISFYSYLCVPFSPFPCKWTIVQQHDMCFYLREKTLEKLRGRSTIAIAWSLTRGRRINPPKNWGSTLAREFIRYRTRPRKREEKKDEPRKRRRRGSDGRDRSCFAYRRIYEPVKPVVSLSPGGKLQPPNGGL